MESMRTLHEQSLDEVRDKMQDLAKASEELRITTEEQLRILIESTQNMIQLVMPICSVSMYIHT